MSEPSPKLGKIFIGGLSYETTDEKLRSYFSAFGPVTDAVVMKDPISRRSRGFGFITYADPICVDRALAQPNHVLDSRRVEAKRAVPRAESTSRDSMSSTSSRNGSVISTASVSSNAGPTKKIFVGGLHYETKDAEFRRYFQQFGKVVSAEVMFNRETNKSRGFGFVIFEHENSVDLVLEESNHVIDGKSVEVKRAVPRTDVPPSRSVSSRANSFSGTTGPGSVGSLDDVSVTSTASVSRSGTPSSSLSASVASLNEGRQGGASGSGPLGGYAAAVRYGGRGMPRANSLHQPSPSHANGASGFDNPERTLARVADALTSLVLDDDVTTSMSSASSSRVSDKVLESPVAPLLSPLGITPRPLDPSADQWSLSPSLGPSRLRDGAHLSPTDARSTWQGRPWQSGWASQAQREEDAARAAQQDPMTTQRLFSPFSGDRRGSRTTLGASTWTTSSYTSTSSEYGASSLNPEPLQLDGSTLNSSGSIFASDEGSNSVFGGSGIGLGPRSPYGAFGSFLQQDFLSSREPELPLESALGGVMDDLNDDKLDLPTHFEQQYS